MAYLRWDGRIVSLPEPDLDAIISGFRHDVVSTTIEVKWCAVGGGGATVGEDDTTPLVGVGKCVAVVAGGSPVASFFRLRRESGSEHPSRKETHPVCDRFAPWGNSVHPGSVCKVAWFCVFKLTPVREEVRA